MKFNAILLILFFVSCKTGTTKKVMAKQVMEDSVEKYDSGKPYPFPAIENKDSIFKFGDYLFESGKDLVFDFYENDARPASLKSKGDSLYHDEYVTILGDINKSPLAAVYKKISLAYDFEMFPVKNIYKGKMAKPDLNTDPDSYGFRTRIREACALDTINFAGHYTIVEWGCGMECVQLAVVDRISGRVFYSTKYIPFDTADGHWLSQYKNNSRMIIVNSGLLEDYPGYCLQDSWRKLVIYEWKGNGFVKLKDTFNKNLAASILFSKKDTIPVQKVNFNRDSSKRISQSGFDNLVDECIILLQEKELKNISNEQHVKIMMCLNTIFMHAYKKGRYEILENISKEKNYTREIINIYPNWIPNRGMGFYFPTLNMELYGTPSLYAIYNVSK